MNEVWGMTLHHKVLISDISRKCCGLTFKGQNVQKHFDIFSLLIFTSYNITQTNRSYLQAYKKYNLPNALCKD